MVLKATPRVETHVCHGKSGQESMVSGVTDSIKEVSVWDRQRLMTKSQPVKVQRKVWKLQPQ